MNSRLASALLATFLCAVTTARAQPQATTPQPAPPASAPDGARSSAALAALAASITEVERDLADARAKLKGGAPADEKARLEAEVKRLGDKRDGLLRNLELVATGFDPGAFDETKDSALDLQAETMELLLPIVQIKMVLNLGSVREGERVIYHGLPWQVRALGVFTELRNPALEDGVLRLPLRDLMPLVSRPDGAEAWFPSAQDDWVHLSDGTHGKIVTQTPDWIELVLLGGSRRTFPTSEFLRLCPENLMGGFRVRSVFGIDYKHQAECTTSIPARLTAKLEHDLRALVGMEHLRHVSVEFHEAAALSLNYLIQADFTAEAAARYTALPRAIQAACVEACNENRWEIPPAPAVAVSAAPVRV